MRTESREGVLAVELDAPHRCLSSAVLGGGLGEMRSWVDAQVPSDYVRTDPEAHLAGLVRELGLPRPAVGMLTAALVEDYVEVARGTARAVATIGLRDPIAAASAEASAGIASGDVPPVGTINLLIVVDAPLTDAALVGAASTAVEAKAQALAAAGVRAADGLTTATGTPTDSLCVACPPGSGARFAGPATPVGADLARTVYDAVVLGAERYAAWRRKNGPVET